MRNQELMKTIRALKAASKERNAAIWGTLADELERAKRRRVAVNLSKINRYSEAGDIVAVPGKVLGAGSLGHPVTVAAFSFSEMAREEVAIAGGRALTLMELLAEGIEPSKIRILK